MIKKIAVAALLASSISLPLAAQSYISIGPVANIGVSRVTGIYTNSLNHLAFGGGLSFIYSKKEHFGIGADLLFSREGYKFDYNKEQIAYNETGNVNMIRIPIKCYYFFNSYKSKVRPKIFAGPSFGFKMGEKVNMEAQNTHTQDLLSRANYTTNSFKNFDIGILLGGGINVNLHQRIWLNLDAGFYQGFLDAVENSGFAKADNENNLHQHLKFQAGLLFGI